MYAIFGHITLTPVLKNTVMETYYESGIVPLIVTVGIILSSYIIDPMPKRRVHIVWCRNMCCLVPEYVCVA